MSKHPLPQKAHWPEGAIFSLGHSTLPIERFVALLQTYGIERLVDIRTTPRSRHNTQFNDTTLAGRLTAEHLEYVHIQARSRRRSWLRRRRGARAPHRPGRGSGKDPHWRATSPALSKAVPTLAQPVRDGWYVSGRIIRVHIPEQFRQCFSHFLRSQIARAIE